MSKPVDPNIAARQRKKIEKDRRRKQYDDLQVQGTNNSSIVSKRSVEMLYSKVLNPELGEWFQHFVKKPKRRSPAINRGYWIRMEAIRRMVERIVAANAGKRVHIINLGCGFDPLPFQLLSSIKDNANLKFLDFDYPDLIQNKLAMIEAAPEILQVIGPRKNVDAKFGVALATDNYQLIGCDLKNETLYAQQLDEFVGGDTDSVKIFIAEVSLAYMKPQYANPVIDLSSRVLNSHFVILEQLLPVSKHDSFAQKMLYHFNHLRSPLQCVETYPLATDQIARFEQYYGHVELRNLFDNWMLLIDDDSKHKIGAIEPFDEWEEFIVFCHHYAIVHATNMDQLVYGEQKPVDQRPLDLDTELKFSNTPVTNANELEIKFGAVCSVGDEIFVHGGLQQTRTSRLVAVRDGIAFERSVAGDVPAARMCHTLTAVAGGAVMIGGRSKPGVHFADVHWLDAGTWTAMAPVPEKRSRHAAVAVSDDEVLVFGGLHHDDGPLFRIYNVATQQTRPLTVQGCALPNLKSAGVAYNGDYGVIVGGMSSELYPLVSRSMYRFVVAGDVVHVELVADDGLYERIGAHVEFLAGRVLVVGGVSPSRLFDRFSNVISVDNGVARAVEIPHDVQARAPPIWVGFGTARTAVQGTPAVAVVGGGAVCYSFGSCYNSMYTVTPVVTMP